MRTPCIYILSNKPNGALYTGVTSNLIQRIYQYKNDLGSNFSTKYKLSKLVYFKVFERMYNAIVREKQLKHWERHWKINLIEARNPTWDDLWDELVNGKEPAHSLRSGELDCGVEVTGGSFGDSRLRGNDSAFGGDSAHESDSTCGVVSALGDALAPAKQDDLSHHISSLSNFLSQLRFQAQPYIWVSEHGYVRNQLKNRQLKEIFIPLTNNT